MEETKLPGKPFQKGDDPRRNLEGRPKGSLSVIGRLKQMFEENPELFEQFVKEYMADANNRRHITEMIDGKPLQKLGNADGSNLTINILDYTNGKTN